MGTYDWILFLRVSRRERGNDLRVREIARILTLVVALVLALREPHVQVTEFPLLYACTASV